MLFKSTLLAPAMMSVLKKRQGDGLALRHQFGWDDVTAPRQNRYKEVKIFGRISLGRPRAFGNLDVMG